MPRPKPRAITLARRSTRRIRCRQRTTQGEIITDSKIAAVTVSAGTELKISRITGYLSSRGQQREKNRGGVITLYHDEDQVFLEMLHRPYVAIIGSGPLPALI